MCRKTDPQAKKYEELTFHDDFMFCKVLEENPELCRGLLELTIGRKIGELAIVQRQKPVEVIPGHHGVRFDVYAKDENQTIYDVEMQNLKRDSLRKRVRYSQSMIDEENLEKGVHYRELKNSYIIFICNFLKFLPIFFVCCLIKAKHLSVQFQFFCILIQSQFLRW